MGQILPFYIVSLLAVYIHISLSGVLDLEEKKQRIRMNISDYLENGKVDEYLKERYQIIDNRKNEKVYFGEEEDLELKELLREIMV